MAKFSENQGVHVVIAGPTNSGKTSIQDLLLKKYLPDGKKVLSTTTRKPRDNEKKGIDYEFCGNWKFLLMKHLFRTFLEDTTYGDSRYGVRRSEITPVLNGSDRVFVATMGITVDLKHYYENAFSPDIARELEDRTLRVLVTTSNQDVIIKRALDRGDDLAKAKKRLTIDWEESKKLAPQFDKVIFNENGCLFQATAALAEIIDNKKDALRLKYGRR